MHWWKARKLKSPWPHERKAAASALKCTGGQRFQAALVEVLLHDDFPEVRREAAAASLFQNWCPQNDEQRASLALSRGAYHGVLVAGASGIERLMRAYNEEPNDPEVRAAIVRALGVSGDPRVVELLIRALVETRDEQAEQAAMAMALSGTDWTGTTEFGEHLSNRSFIVRCAAADVLGEVQDPEAVAPLRHALSDEHPDVVAAAAAALKRFGVDVAAEVPHQKST